MLYTIILMIDLIKDLIFLLINILFGSVYLTIIKRDISFIKLIMNNKGIIKNISIIFSLSVFEYSREIKEKLS